jgi:Domain of unknown function (DUF4389)
MVMSTSYPVRVDAHLDTHLSRWLWLVKWLLAIPHYVVLFFLWMAFVVLSVVAMFAIVITGRYPRSIFDFNVGVLRWTWRVNYYAYSALGTDQYPPFTLQERPDYPAHLEIDYPEHLSRGLALVKWWLLAIPHYLLVGLFISGVAYTVDTTNDLPQTWSMGLIGLLVLIAAVMLLVTGRYPSPIFDLVLGLNRWVLRVAGYAGLMTDQYPPFRLDQGGTDPGHLVTRASDPSGASGSGTPMAPPPGTPAVASPPPPETRHGWTAGRVVAVVLGSLLLIGAVGTGLGAGGVAMAKAARNDDGFLMSPEHGYVTDSYALVTEGAQITTDTNGDWALREFLGDARVTATGTGQAVFVGIASTTDVDGYLAGAAHATISRVGADDSLTVSGTGAPGTLPADSDIWVGQASGTGTQEVVWPVESGDWTIVVMNADASPGVDARLSVGATVPALDWMLPGLLVTTGVLLVLAIPCFVVAFRPVRD